MRKFGTAILALALLLIVFWLGMRFQDQPAAPAKAAADEASLDRDASSTPQAQPTRTFRGPDGRPHLINYEVGKVLDDHDPALVREGVLADMRNHPENIQSSYGIPLADIQRIVAGTAPMPDQLQPAPAPSPAPPN